ncbi:metallophosphoesterase family protein [Bifidobacterium biavatii]|uniref:Nuclease SbcCD subunit D n=1 Tax=Bifidobacterium biavatii DSM 23969 TaxID=1437608 RepID=A0A087A0B3_9BIFI|nr:exonuclease SbcCD subunit D C-terminal domain-containing protein [Bifidobacterium biavatii]KFI52213.1 putative nuclease SbcCD, D subunit [Bifidobacterium biavatii DSM 23969]
MRVLHTSDWHIGRRFKGLSLLEYQRNALEWLIGVIEREHVQVLCVSGDVYDQSMPSGDAVQLFNEMFVRLGRTVVDGESLEIVITPGNHDSAVRLDAGSALMQPNIHMRCRIDDIAEPVIIDRGNESMAVYALPYLDPDAARSQLQGILESRGVDWTIPRSHEGMMRAALQLVTRDLAERRVSRPDMPAILMAHAFVGGAQSSDSERAITVGGVDSVPAGLFSNSGLDYLALGHLHRPQQVRIPVLDAADSVFAYDRTPQARYSGSLLAYSFSEGHNPPVAGNGKSVVVFDASSRGIENLYTLPVESDEPAFAQVEGSVEEIQDEKTRQRHRDDWVSVTVHVSEFPQGIYQKIDDWYPHALEKNLVYDRRADSSRRKTVDLRKVTSEMEVLDRFVYDQLDRTPNDEERAVLEHAVESVRNSRAEYAGDGNADDTAKNDDTTAKER